jgi:hypothetical protein
MSRRAALLPMLAAGLLLGGCSDNTPTDVALAGDSQLSAEPCLNRRAPVMVPIAWTYHMASVPGAMLTCTNSDGSPPFLAVPVDYVASGFMTDLGRTDPDASTAAFTSCTVQLEGGNPVTGDASGDVRLVGANGDAIEFSGVLTLSFANYSATGRWTITGGSGRFTGATGWIRTYEVPAADGNGSDGHGWGMISQPHARVFPPKPRW